MSVTVSAWIDLVQREYLRRFVPGGGSAIKFLVGNESVLNDLRRQLAAAAGERRLHFVSIDAATTKLHMIQDVFFAVARTIDWNVLAQRWVEAVFRKHQYEWPRRNEAVPIQEIAAANKVDDTLLKREVLQWLTNHIMTDKEMAQDFRAAVTHLCMRRMELADARAVAPVIEWLHGELRALSAVKNVPINGKITRHNGRAMLRSLCRWLRLSGGPGLVASVDLRQIGRAGAAVGDGIRYSPAAVLDTFEVLRQLIDDVETFEGLFLVVVADAAFTDGDPKRNINNYEALKMRILSDVHARHRENPFAPLLHLAADGGCALAEPDATATQDMPFVVERVAIEALRAGVPNRAAIRLLGSSERALGELFVARLRDCKDGLHAGRRVEGEIVTGGFGTGKSHLLGFFSEQALRENFIVSQVPISKETPLFDPARVFAAAIRNAVVPGMNDDVMTAVVRRLDPGSPAFMEVERWAGDPASELSPLFAALLYLLPRQVLATDDAASITRFFAGAKIGVAKVRQWLKAAGAVELFNIRPVKAADLALQRLRFAPRLFAAAGFAGWCVLLDEVELIGKYTTLQRGKSYAELCRWLGLHDEVKLPGVVSVCAITDDFKSVVIDNRRDDKKVPTVLLAKGLHRQAPLAKIGIEEIDRQRHRLRPPDDATLRASLDRVRSLYGQAYGWSPPSTHVGERLAGKTMRQYIKSWITMWDIQRLYGQEADMVTEQLVPDYTENKDIEEAAPVDIDDESVA